MFFAWLALAGTVVFLASALAAHACRLHELNPSEATLSIYLSDETRVLLLAGYSAWQLPFSPRPRGDQS